VRFIQSCLGGQIVEKLAQILQLVARGGQTLCETLRLPLGLPCRDVDLVPVIRLVMQDGQLKKRAIRSFFGV